ncbi:MAG: SMC-Scp complex subunit ScpB [Terriglobales bacterium]
MAIKAEIEAIIYAAEEPVTIDQMALVLKDSVLAEGGFEEGLEPKALDAEVKKRLRIAVEELAAEYDDVQRGMEIRQVAGGWRMATKPEHHDAVRHFVKSLKPPVKLSLPALETLAVIAYKQPVTAPEISEIRGVDSSGVLATLLDRKLITTAGRKQVIGRPIMYKTSKDFLLRFGLKDVTELPSLEEFEKLGSDGQTELFEANQAVSHEGHEGSHEGPDGESSAPAAVEGEGGNVESEPSLTPGQESSQSSEAASEFPQAEAEQKS